MEISSLLEPMAACPFCERRGMMGYDREVVGGKAVAVFKCHHCRRVWELTSDVPPAVKIRNPG